MSIGHAICFSMASVIAGIAVGILYSCIYIRVVYKRWISLSFVLKMIFKAPPITQRNNHSRSQSLIRKLHSSSYGLKKVLLPILDAGSRLSFPSKYGDIGGNSDLSFHNEFVEKQTDQLSTEPESEGEILSLTEQVEQQVESDNMIDESRSYEVVKDDNPVFPAQGYHKNPLSVFLDELGRNREIINEFAGDQLLPLETAFWDANKQLVDNMTPVLKNLLSGLYNDIALLNNLVWLSTEFNRISPNMRIQYTKLIGIIAANLEKVFKVAVFFDQVDTDLAPP
jgi:hypothetical protein